MSNQAGVGRRTKAGQLSGLAFIESLYFRAGAQAAQGQLQRLLGTEESGRNYALCDIGKPAVETMGDADDEISYESFSPPVSWNAAYSVLRATVGPKSKNDYRFHSGEEILIPSAGKVVYHFFWSPGASPPERTVLNPAVGEGQILRINPQIPHHAWSAKGLATGWLILRHTMNSPVALVMDENPSLLPANGGEACLDPELEPRQGSRARSSNRGRVTANSLRKPGVYGLIAWGISERIRDARLKAGLTPTDLARQVGIDPSSISRLEEAKTNVSLQLLAKVCSALRIGMAECMQSGSWMCERDELDPNPQDGGRILQTAKPPHNLHVSILQLTPGKRRIVSTGWATEASSLSSWLVLAGRVVVDVPERAGVKSVMLDIGNVFHFRRNAQASVYALEESKIAQCLYSPVMDCPCRTLAASAKS